jgi:hypothetical protein
LYLLIEEKDETYEALRIRPYTLIRDGTLGQVHKYFEAVERDQTIN